MVNQNIEIDKDKKVNKRGNPAWHKGMTSPNPAGMPRGLSFKHRAEEIKNQILNVFEKTGGANSMIDWAKKNEFNKREFYKMMISLLPKEVNVEGGEQNTIVIINYGDKKEQI
jgi:hypothetical protein